MVCAENGQFVFLFNMGNNFKLLKKWSMLKDRISH
jgi:hypothetical protein